MVQVGRERSADKPAGRIIWRKSYNLSDTAFETAQDITMKCPTCGFKVKTPSQALIVCSRCYERDTPHHHVTRYTYMEFKHVFLPTIEHGPGDLEIVTDLDDYRFTHWPHEVAPNTDDLERSQ